MTKKIIVLLSVLILSIGLSACSKPEKVVLNAEPRVSQMVAISELAAMECYYHNVAKYYEKDASGMLLWKKDKEFWIEYSGIVKIGIDTSLLSLEVNEDQVIITIPEAEVLDNRIDSSTLTKDAFIVDENSAKITADDETKAFAEAQEKMVEAAKNDTALLNSAQQRAKKLLEEYVNNIGEAIGKNYRIEWVYISKNEPEVEE